MFRFKTIITLMLIIGALVGFYLYTNQDPKVDSALTTLHSKYVGPDGVFKDPTDELGLSKDPKVYYKKDGEKVEVYYGNVAFTLDPRIDLSQLKNTLSSLGLEVGYSANGSFFIKYKGKLVKEVVL